ncbi:MAG: amidohydrolase [Candidatus Dormibacteria bacterium]
MLPQLLPEVIAVRDDVVAWRRHLHAHPELGFQEHETARYVAQVLQEIGGLEITHPTATSVLARLRSTRPGRTIALRADMDALPVAEETGLPFSSQVPGVMHACGHDGHTAILLGAARLLSARREDLGGEVRFIFQHSEELAPGGAQELVAAGVMDGVEMVAGEHLRSLLEVGQVALSSGPVQAAADEFRISIKGEGGHAAYPQLAVDSVAIGAEVVSALQHVVSRQTDPFDTLVLSVTMFHAGTAENVIPPVAEMVGTVRAFREELRRQTEGRMDKIIRGITQGHGADYSFQYQYGYQPVVNDERVTGIVREALTRSLGEGSVIPATPTMGAEDFSAYQKMAPGVFFYVGAGNRAKGLTRQHHHGLFAIDEDCLGIGVQAMVATAEALLSADPD